MNKVLFPAIKSTLHCEAQQVDYISNEIPARGCAACPDRRRGLFALADATGRAQEFIGRFDDPVCGLGSLAFRRTRTGLVESVVFESKVCRGASRGIGIACDLRLYCLRTTEATARVLVPDRSPGLMDPDRDRSYFRSVSFTFALTFPVPRSTCTETSSPALCARRA